MTTVPLKSGRMLSSSAFSRSIEKKGQKDGHGETDKPGLGTRLLKTTKKFLNLRGAPQEIARGFAACAPEILWILTVGGFAAGLPLAVLSYFLCDQAIRRYRGRSGIAAGASLEKPGAP